MDTNCQHCGEPIDILELHDWPGGWEGKQATDFKKGKGCPTCNWGEKQPHMPEHAELASIAHDLLGDDIDGIAAMLEDAEYLGLFD